MWIKCGAPLPPFPPSYCLPGSDFPLKACTSLVGFSIGDILAQKSTTAKDGEFSYERLCRMAAFGFLFHGTISHFFYNALDGALPGTAAVTVVQKASLFINVDFIFIFYRFLGI